MKISKAGDGKYQDGNGLILIKRRTAGKWVYRYSCLGKRREMGLGSLASLGLAEARKERDRWAQFLARGEDPIVARNRQREAEREERDRDDPTFAEMAQRTLESLRATLRDGGARGRWKSPLDLHVNPAIGNMRMSKVHPSDIRDALAAIWQSKHPTAPKGHSENTDSIPTSEVDRNRLRPFHSRRGTSHAWRSAARSETDKVGSLARSPRMSTSLSATA